MCVRALTHTHVCARVHECTCMCMCEGVRAHVNVMYEDGCVSVCACVYMYEGGCMSMCACVYIYVRALREGTSFCRHLEVCGSSDHCMHLPCTGTDVDNRSSVSQLPSYQKS